MYDIAADAVTATTATRTPHDVARECGTVITMLPSNPRSVYIPSAGDRTARRRRSWHSVH